MDERVGYDVGKWRLYFLSRRQLVRWRLRQEECEELADVIQIKCQVRWQIRPETPRLPIRRFSLSAPGTTQRCLNTHRKGSSRIVQGVTSMLIMTMKPSLVSAFLSHSFAFCPFRQRVAHASSKGPVSLKSLKCA